MEQITCDIAKRMILNYVDGEVEGLQRAYLRAHIKQCSSCHKRYRILRQSRDLLKESFRTFAPKDRIDESFKEQLPKRYPLPDFNPSSIRNLELAGKEGILTPDRQPIPRTRLALYAAGIVLAVVALGFFFVPLAWPVIQDLMGWKTKPVEMHFSIRRQMLSTQPDATHFMTASKGEAAVFGLGRVGFGAMVDKTRMSLVEHNSAENYWLLLLRSGTVYVDSRAFGEWVIFQFGQGRLNQVSGQEARFTVTFIPDAAYPDKIEEWERVIVHVFSGTLLLGDNTVRPGDRAEMVRGRAFRSEPMSISVSAVDQYSPPVSELPQVDSAVRNNKRPVLEQLDKLLWTATGKAQESGADTVVP